MKSSSYPPGTIAALALSGIILSFLISLLLFYFLFWRHRVRRRRLTERPVKPQHRESGDVVVIQRGKYANIADEVDPISPPPRDAGQDEKPESILDNASFRFAFVPKGKAKSNSDRTTNSPSFYSHAIMDADLIPPRRDTVPRSPSRATSDIVILPTPTVPPRATVTLDDIQPPSNGRSTESVSAGQEALVSQTTTVRSQPLSQVPPIPAGSEIRVAPSTQATPTPPIETAIGVQAAATSPESLPLPRNGDDDDFEYVDLDVLGGGSGEPSGSSRPHGEVVEGSEDQEGSGPARRRSSVRDRDSQDIVEDDSNGPPQFLRVRESSPFRVDFQRGSLKPSRPSTARTRHSGSRVRFQDEPPEESKSSDDNSTTSPTQALAPTQAPASAPEPESAPASAPIIPSIPITTGPRRVDRSAITSFLDLTGSLGSPAGSLRTHSSSGSSRQSRPPERSRWSTTTTSQSVYTNPSNTNIASPTGTGNEDSRRSLPTSSRVFPFRVSFNPPHIQRRSTEARESRPPEVQQILIPASPASPPAAHPFAFPESAILPSPTHSVPTTISDLHFRHSLSDDASRIESQRASTGSHLPPHPPLPSGFEFRRHHRDRSSLSQLSSTLANQPSIVQRVLGLQSPGSEPSSHTLGRNTSAMSGTSRAKSPSLARRFRP